PRVSIDSADGDLRRLADTIAAKGFVVGSLVAPVWPPTGGGSAMGGDEERKNFITQVQGVRDCQETAGPRYPQLRRCPHRFGVEPRRLVEGSRRQHEANRRDVPSGV